MSVTQIGYNSDMIKYKEQVEKYKKICCKNKKEK